MAYFQVSMEEVLENFKAFGLYHPERLHFCKGYFVDSLPHCHPSKIAVLRMDGDMYESTMDQLFNLYPLVSLGGFVIVDDWNVEHCQRAVTDFWEWHGLLDEVAPVNGSAMKPFFLKIIKYLKEGKRRAKNARKEGRKRERA
ncbi:Macrocin O-methyltransferase [Balamuthia mandrillaris]